MDVSLVLTHDCNLACDYCFAGEKTRRAMAPEVIERALHLAFSDGAPRVKVAFFGGEPLLEWERLLWAVAQAEARARAASRELVFTVTTNGTLLDDERVAYLVARGFFIGLSIDGVREAHEATRPRRGGQSSFPRARAALERLIAADAWFETVSVVDPRNVAWLGASVRWLAAMGVERISLNPNFAADWSEPARAAWARGYEEAGELYLARALSDRPLYLNVIEDKMITHAKGGYAPEDHCSLGRDSVAVAPSGNLYPCERMVGEDSVAALRLGDVFRGLDQGRRMILGAQVGHGAPECGDCAVEPRCMAFCACANLAETGWIAEPGSLLCWHEQLAIRVADEVGARLWKARNRHFLQRVYGLSPVAR
jgi:uncharacterized protein